VILQLAKEAEGREAQRRAQQGLGRPIVSTEVKGNRVIMVGNRPHWSKQWKSFHDFLFDYLRDLLGADWGNAELKKPFPDRHPVIQWYHHCCLLQREHVKTPGSIAQIPMNGAAASFMGLAYNLYLLAHNVEVQERLLKRLRDTNNFHGNFYGAAYEIFVAGALIRTGFRLELEDEAKGITTHCEFTAVHEASGRRFSVEAKSRYAARDETDSGESALRVGRHLRKALKKRALHQRIVFIDLNLPSLAQGSDGLALLGKAQATVREMEETLMIDGAPAPSAYVFLTNFPYHHALESDDIDCVAYMEPFKIADLRAAERPVPLRVAIDTRDRHRIVADILQNIATDRIPSTFDGDIPELAFHAPADRRIVIGRRYDFSEEGLPPLIGEVTDVIVDEAKKELMIRVQNDDGGATLMTRKMSEEELTGYRSNRDTYFGIHRKVYPEAKTALDLYDFMMDTYSKMPKERLLKQMVSWPDQELLGALSQQELASIYCERMAIVGYQMQGNSAA
jgi:hypothetical protein